MRKRILVMLVAVVACADADKPSLVGPQFSSGSAPFVAQAVATGAEHACAIGVDRNTYCWGDNVRGQLGDGANTGSTRPVPVRTPVRLVSITSGGWDHTCGLTAEGQAYCWGWNAFGQLGDGTTTSRNAPVPAAGGLRFTALDAGVYHTCGITADGTAFCWGAGSAGGVDGNGLGAPTSQLCDNPENYRGTPWPCSTTPVRVDGNVAFGTISAGLWTSCALARAGETYCWGWNIFWQLGNGSLIGAQAPVRVSGPHRFDVLSTGAVHSCGIESNRAFCWGARRFDFGQIGDGGNDGAAEPTAVAGGIAFSQVAASDANDIWGLTCGLDVRGHAFCWGMNRLGALGSTALMNTCPIDPAAGSSECSNTPVPVAGNERYIDIATGAEFACAVGLNRAVSCWGRNSQGQLGDGTTEHRRLPVRVLAPGRGGSHANAPARAGKERI